MEMNDIEKARSAKEFEVFCKNAGIYKTRPMHDQLTAAAHDGRLKSNCCDGKCKGHSADT